MATYNGKDELGRAKIQPGRATTIGGYTTKYVVDERFAILVPKDYPLEAVRARIIYMIYIYIYIYI